MIELGRLLKATAHHGGDVVGPAFAREFTGFSHDSRTVAPGEMFVALRTGKADGHEFIADAVARGATGVLCERAPAVPGGSTAAGATVVRVDDTRAALLDWAAFVLAERDADIYRMAVAGAVGKSSARSALVRALGSPFPAAETGWGAAAGAGAVFTNGNRNDELGLPLSLGGLRAEHDTAVFEVAGGSGAELQRLGRLVRPRLVLLTGGAPPASEDAASVSLRDGLADFLAALAPDGVLAVNGDDRDLEDLLENVALPERVRVLEYGFGPGMAVGGRVVESDARGTLLEVTYAGKSSRVRLDGPGLGLAGAALAAAAAVAGSGRDPGSALARLDGLRPEPGRLGLLTGRDGLTLLDDSYSANAASLRLALKTLDLFPRPHVAVLGEISGVSYAGALPDELAQRLLELDRLVLQGREQTALSRELRARSAHPERIVLTFSARDSADAAAEQPEPSSSALEPEARQEQGGNESEPFGGSSAAGGIAETTLAAGAVQPELVPPATSGAAQPELVPPALGTGATAATVLVKGSDAARMERVVELLLPETAPAREVLVRQDEGWRQRTYVPAERPTWVEVDLDAIRANLRLLREAAAPAQVMAVLKADAYGHGARWVARTAALNGAAMLGVASLNEALDLRADGILAPILILGYAPPWQARELALSDVRATVFSLSVAEQFSRVARDLGREIAVHIKVDTGMTRLGVLPEEALAFVDALAALPGLRLEGIFSHLATSDSDVPFALEQGERFAALLRQLDARGHRFRYVHMENSAAVLRRLPFACNLVRVGLALYGLSPLPDGQSGELLRPALSFKTRVAQVKRVPAGTTVSYGRTWAAARPSHIAVLPVGYGDGVRRSPRNWGQVLVRGQRAPIVGVVTMDMTMIDVTDVTGVQEGDEVVLIGRQGQEAITVEDVAAALGTISYEVVTQILPRVPRQMR